MAKKETAPKAEQKTYTEEEVMAIVQAKDKVINELVITINTLKRL